MHRRSTSASVLAVGLLASSCGSSDAGRVDVLAASSFTDVAPDLEALIEDELDVDVEFSFGSSGSFLEQLRQGAPASVVLTADAPTMQRIADAGVIGSVASLAANELVIVTAQTERGRAIESLADLASGDAVVVLCTSSAPCGAATDVLLDRAGLDVDAASREPNVRATLTKVRLGEADAALVYRTDALASPELRLVELDDTERVVGQVGVEFANDTAFDVLAVLLGERAARIFDDAGFGRP